MRVPHPAPHAALEDEPRHGVEGRQPELHQTKLVDGLLEAGPSLGAAEKAEREGIKMRI